MLYQVAECYLLYIWQDLSDLNTGAELPLKLIVCLHCAVQIAKAEKLKPMEVELKKLEDLSESIVNDFAYMRAREEEMRDTNGKF